MRVLRHIYFPFILAMFIWSTADFPTEGPLLDRVIIAFLVLYVPGKVIKLLIHKETGVLRDNRVVVSIAGGFVGLIWAAIVTGGFVWTFREYGLIGGLISIVLIVPGSGLVAYTLLLIWGSIRGDDVS